MIKKLRTLDPRFQKLLRLTSKLSRVSGYRAYLVGGVVRDLLLGKEVYDLDIVVEGSAIALCEKLCEHLRLDFIKHHTFGTATISFGCCKIDFATARKETYRAWGVLPRVEPASLREDLFRRDFTINAMAVSINKEDFGRLIDFYNGAQDLKGKFLRVLHDNSFLDDPTRLLRAVRFEQRLGFVIEKHTLSLMRAAVRSRALTYVHSHRLRDELYLILKEKKPFRYIARIHRLFGFSFIDPGLKLTGASFKLLARVEKTLCHYEAKCVQPYEPGSPKSTHSPFCGGRRAQEPDKRIEGWLVYLMAIVIGLPSKNISIFLEKFSLRKGERIRIESVKQNLKKIRTLKKSLKPHQTYRLLHRFSFESIVFFYAYFTHTLLRRNIEDHLIRFARVKLRINGDDLRRAGIAPLSLYGRIFEQVLYSKLDAGYKNKQDELRAAKAVGATLRQ